jgi:hypothetical protein
MSEAADNVTAMSGQRAARDELIAAAAKWGWWPARTSAWLRDHAVFLRPAPGDGAEDTEQPEYVPQQAA